MKLYLISQDVNTGYDTYDSAVVSAKSEADARTIHPSAYTTHAKNGKWMGTYADTPHTRETGAAGKEYPKEPSYDWVSYSKIEAISVEYLGETDKPRGVILASFNAG